MTKPIPKCAEMRPRRGKDYTEVRKNRVYGPEIEAERRAKAAHDCPPDPGDVAGRVNLIESLMIRGLFVRGGTGKLFARAWGLSRAHLNQCAAEASRRVGLSMTPEERRQLLITEGEAITEKAMSSGDLAAAVSSLKLRAELSGLLVKRVEQTTTFASIEDANAVLREFGFEVLPAAPPKQLQNKGE